MNNVFKSTFAYRNYYIHHPLKFFKHLFRAIKFSYQRIIRGWAEIDAWDMNTWMLNVLPEMLKSLAQKGISYPYKYENRDKWKEELINHANNFSKILDDTDDRCEDKVNEFFDWIKENFYDLWD